jgi:hypothetical protein
VAQTTPALRLSSPLSLFEERGRHQAGALRVPVSRWGVSACETTAAFEVMPQLLLRRLAIPFLAAVSGVARGLERLDANPHATAIELRRQRPRRTRSRTGRLAESLQQLSGSSGERPFGAFGLAQPDPGAGARIKDLGAGAEPSQHPSPGRRAAIAEATPYGEPNPPEKKEPPAGVSFRRGQVRGLPPKLVP